MRIINLIDIYDPNKDPKNEPYLANNSYTETTIMNAKNPEIYENTKNIIIRVYTQDLYNKHEDRFLFWLSTQSNLYSIKNYYPHHKWTSEIIIPPKETLENGFLKLNENTLSFVSHALRVIVFQGHVYANENNVVISEDKCQKVKKILDYNYTDHEMIKNFYFAGSDLAGVIEKYVINQNICIFRFEHYGVNKWKNQIPDKIKFFDFDGNIVENSFSHNELQEDDESRPVYHLNVLYDFILETMKCNKYIQIIDLHVCFIDNLKNDNELNDEIILKKIQNHRLIFKRIKNILYDDGDDDCDDGDASISEDYDEDYFDNDSGYD